MIIPAIDVINNEIVRLIQGDFEQQTPYEGSVSDRLIQYQKAGAKRIHLVDLSRAKNPELRGSKAILDALKAAKVPIQVGGGIRTDDDVENWLNKGASKVVVGSVAITNQSKVMSWAKSFGQGKIVISLDVKANQENEYEVCINGWQKNSGVKLSEVLLAYQAEGINEFLCTDIQQDGTLKGPNIELYQWMKSLAPNALIQASGGVGTLKDIIDLKVNRMDGVILGKSLLEGRFSLKEALSVWEKESANAS